MLVVCTAGHRSVSLASRRHLSRQVAMAASVMETILAISKPHNHIASSVRSASYKWSINTFMISVFLRQAWVRFPPDSSSAYSSISVCGLRRTRQRIFFRIKKFGIGVSVARFQAASSATPNFRAAKSPWRQIKSTSQPLHSLGVGLISGGGDD